MGAWGAGLFCDDVACDVRTQFRELLAGGQSVAQATRRVLDDWREAVEDDDDGPVIWLVLASLQWDRGALQNKVRKKAIGIIDRGDDLERWRNSADARKVSQRKTVLRKLREKLLSPQSVPKQTSPDKNRAKAPREKSAAATAAPLVPQPWKVGELVGYRLKSGDWILLHIVECSTARRVEDVNPTFALLDWSGTELPDEQQAKTLRYRKPPATTLAYGDEVAEIGEQRAYCIEVAHRKVSQIPVKRLRWLSMSRKLPFRKPRGWNPGVLWRLFDAQLKADLGLS